MFDLRLVSWLWISELILSKLLNAEGSKLFRALYMKQQVCNLLVFFRVNIRNLSNIGPVCAFHLAKVIIRMAFFCFRNRLLSATELSVAQMMLQ